MVKPKPNIVISLPLVWSIRNFLLSGVADSLAAKYNIYYAVDDNNKKILLEYKGHNINILTVNNGGKYIRIATILRKSFLLKYKELEYISAIMKKGKIIGINNNFITCIKECIYLIVSRLVVLFRAFPLLENFWFKLSGRSLDEKFASEIVRINPVFILSTTCVVEMEQPLIFYARENNIPIYTHILSFDNITSRGYVPIGKFDKYFVWNELMKTELIHYYSVKPERIFITGTPQFDFHNSNKFLRSRGDTLKQFDLEQTDRYLLYCANHIHLTPGEPELLENLIQKLQGDAQLNDIKLIVRLHPLDNYDRWQFLFEKFKGRLRLSIPWSHPVKENPALGMVTEEDMVKFVNLLRYAETVLNIASTVTIDAAIVNTPVICLGYHPSNSSESECYYNYHFSEHYKILMKFGASPIALNGEELISLIHKDIENRERLSVNRDQLASYYIEDYKKSSAEKLIRILLND
jgi:hypothetical protein